MSKKSLYQMNHRVLLGLFRSSHRRCSVKKGVLKKFGNFPGKHLCWSLFLIKLQAWACNFIKKRLQRWCFPVKFAEFLRTSILKNICERLLLFVSPQNTIANSSGVFALDETLTECKVSIFFLNVTILFDQMQPYHLKVKKCFFKISINIPIKFLTLRSFETLK